MRVVLWSACRAASYDWFNDDDCTMLVWSLPSDGMVADALDAADLGLTDPVLWSALRSISIAIGASDMM